MSVVNWKPLIYDRDCADEEAVELRVVEYEGDRKVERTYTFPPDKAVTLGLSLAARGWRLKGAKVTP